MHMYTHVLCVMYKCTRMESWVDLGGLLGIAIKAMQQGGDDAVHSSSCATLEQDAECSSSSLHINRHVVGTSC